MQEQHLPITRQTTREERANEEIAVTTTMEQLRQEFASVQARHRANPEMVRGLKVPYYRRGVMSIPGFRMKAGSDVESEGRQQSLRVMAKATQFPVDFFFYDLEDAAPDHPSYKALAREFVIEALTTFDFGDRVVAFRPNNIRTPYFADDLVEVVSRAGHKLQAIVLPKTEHSEEVADTVRLVRDIQRLAGHSNEIVLEVLIESPKALLEVEKIAALDGVAALAFGAWDFARTIGGNVTDEGWIHDQMLARQRLPIVAAAYGKEAVDTITRNLPIRPKKPEGTSDETYRNAIQQPADQLSPTEWSDDFIDAVRKRQSALALARRDALNARAIGFAAKWILHPDQIDVIQGAWTPTRDKALHALKILADYAKAAQTGSGAELEGTNQLVDKAVFGTHWWEVQASVRGNVLTDEDFAASGFTYAELQRHAVTHDEHSLLSPE